MGAVIAGGAARRFGSDKALAEWNGQPLIEHAIAALRPWVAELVVCGREHGGLTSLADRPQPGMGPLGGIAAALAHAEDQGFGAVLTMPCDMPELPTTLAQGLLAAAPNACCIDHPVIGLWSVGLRPLLERHLATPGNRSIRRWAEIAGSVPVAWSAPLPNINRPEDLAELRFRGSDPT